MFQSDKQEPPWVTWTVYFAAFWPYPIIKTEYSLFKQINSAFEIIRTETTRQEFDKKWGQKWQSEEPEDVWDPSGQIKMDVKLLTFPNFTFF